MVTLPCKMQEATSCSSASGLTGICKQASQAFMITPTPSQAQNLFGAPTPLGRSAMITSRWFGFRYSESKFRECTKQILC
mmetsp:Transcript_10702/g.16151  ORF Transcript_10702/g.16151 Transcript_10702/m.16151 type:complete len:80 (-) Transcript_10702:154-393(-)